MKKIIFILFCFLLFGCVSTRQFKNHKRINNLKLQLIEWDIKCNKYEIEGLEDDTRILKKNKYEEIARDAANLTNKNLEKEIKELLSIMSNRGNLTFIEKIKKIKKLFLCDINEAYEIWSRLQE